MPFKRKNIRLSPENYEGQRAYFVTICCQDRRPALRDRITVSHILETLRDLASEHGFAVHAYCIMPDHGHFLLEGLTPQSDLLDFMNRFKQQTAFAYRRRFRAALWQFKYYDHILRRSDAMDDVAWYIWMNPVRARLCGEPREFPFSGSFTLRASQRPRNNATWMPPWKKRGKTEMPG
jgi:putative transposase